MPKRRLKRDTVAYEVHRLQSNEVVLVPDGVDLDEEELLVFKQMTSTREAMEWAPAQLLLAAQCAQTLVLIRGWREMLKESAPLLRGNNGPKANPLLNIIDTEERRLLAMMRGLQMLYVAGDPRTLAGRAPNNNAHIGVVRDGGDVDWTEVARFERRQGRKGHST
jgi:hypothetical protein